MKVLLTACALTSASAFVVAPHHSRNVVSSTARFGYLDDLSKELYAEADEPDVENTTREKTNLDKDKLDRFGVGDWKDYVEFEEFDGGDGQMGVAGDGKKGLEKEWEGAAEMAKSKSMSAKNAWGTSTGYADELVSKGVEQQRAQQLENWHNQQEVLNKRKAQRFITEEFDKINTSTDEDWRNLSSFGVARNDDFDLDATFGAVVPGDRIDGVVELQSRVNRIEVFEFTLKNSFMGFSDFRARIYPGENKDWTIEPAEGSLNGRQDTEFTLKFRPQNPGVSEAYLVIDTEDDKWTWQLFGSGSM